MYARSILKIIRQQPVGEFSLPPRLIPVDRVMQRWDTAHRGGYPMDEDKDPVSRPPALDDDTTMVVDDIIRVIPGLSRELVMLWYRSDLPCYMIAERLKCTDRALRKRHALVLHFLRNRFIGTANLTLLRLLRVRT